MRPLPNIGKSADDTEAGSGLLRHRNLKRIQERRDALIAASKEDQVHDAAGTQSGYRLRVELR